MTKNIIWPDYKNCSANLPNSILKYFGAKTVGETLPLADQVLSKEYKNVVVFLLDGMGRVTMEKLLDANGPFRSHLAGTYQSVFLSSTVPATTSVLAGLQPCEHGWLGWDQYFPQVDQNVTVFLNTISGTQEPASEQNLAWTYLPYKDVITRINEAGGHAYASMPFMPPFPDSFDAICDRVKELCHEPEKKYIYAYYSEPDGLLHRNGSDDPIVKETLQQIEKQISEMIAGLEDTLVIITADHGHIDNQRVKIQDYPQLYECLERAPSLEPRVADFKVKEEKKTFFETEFRKTFAEKFILMTMEEALQRKLFGDGKEHEQFRPSLGNYLAIAIDELSIFFGDEPCQSMHGGITEEEVIVPLIVFDT